MNKKLQEKRERNKKDKEWRAAIVKEYKGQCVICGDKKMPNAHHIIPKNFLETRWDEKNGILLCPKHHKFGKFSAHKNPLWFIPKLGQCELKKYQYLMKKLNKIINNDLINNE